MSRRPRSQTEEIIRRPETKSFILTSEFWVAAGAAAGVFVGGYVLDDIANTTAWRYGTWIAIAYILSRGIAKAGSQRAYQPESALHGDGNGFWREGDNYQPAPPRQEAQPVAMPADVSEPRPSSSPNDVR